MLRGSVTFANASEKYSYVYDAANQLIRENLYYGTGNSNNATITYQYDSWGNLITNATLTKPLQDLVNSKIIIIIPLG